jgi:hypothetical protein
MRHSELNGNKHFENLIYPTYIEIFLSYITLTA